jgi:hypothetical protein
MSLQQVHTCIWCLESRDITPTASGAMVPTACKKCGTNGPTMNWADLAAQTNNMIHTNSIPVEAIEVARYFLRTEMNKVGDTDEGERGYMEEKVVEITKWLEELK